MLMLITDSIHWTRPTAEVVAEALKGGVNWVQLREKHLPAGELYEQACRLRTLTENHGAKLVINDRLDVAQASGADGVHLGTASLPVETARRLQGPNTLIGASTHDLAEATAAESQGADYVTFGPVFATPSKEGILQPRGLGPVADAADALGIPVIGLGGITADNATSVIASGARGIAMIRALGAAPDVAKAARRILRAIQNVEPGRDPKRDRDTE